jgi:SAM-dependent methyltransferase
MAWYHNFFHGLPQDAWKAAQTDEQTQLDLELLVETLEFGPGDRLLDVFCGYGRHALPLARLGARVTGVDISEEYIAELEAATEKLPLMAVQGDFMQLTNIDLAVDTLFDAGYCLGNSFSFFPRPDMLVFLKRIAALLKPGGRFLAQSEMIAESVLPDYQARNWQPIGDSDGEQSILFLVENEYDPLESRIDSHLTYVRDGVIQTRLAQHYVYTLAELCRLFREAGFTVVTCYGTVDGNPYTLGDEAVWLVAEKA